MKSKFVAGAFLVLTLTFMSMCGYIVQLRKDRSIAEAALASSVLEAEGYQESLAVKPKEVIKLVPTLVTKEVVKLVKDKTVQPIAATKTEAHKDVVVNCPAQPEATPAPVHLTFYSNMLITRIKFGIATEWKADAGGSIAMDKDPPVPFKFDESKGEVKFEVRFSEEIAKALHDHEREGSWLKRHTALQCPGVGLVFNPLTKRVEAGVSCTYGFVWF